MTSARPSVNHIRTKVANLLPQPQQRPGVEDSTPLEDIDRARGGVQSLPQRPVGAEHAYTRFKTTSRQARREKTDLFCCSMVAQLRDDEEDFHRGGFLPKNSCYQICNLQFSVFNLQSRSSSAVPLLWQHADIR
jgi:hypothetical protein